MKKQWLKHSDHMYSFLNDEKEIGKMELLFNNPGKANCTIAGDSFNVSRTDFWKSSLEFTDSNHAVVLKMYPEKWYANASIIEFENKNYKLIVRNNPLAEYVITENGNDILAYGLVIEDKKPKLRIATSGNHHPVLDFLLWYLFHPVANENFGNSYIFFGSELL